MWCPVQFWYSFFFLRKSSNLPDCSVCFSYIHILSISKRNYFIQLFYPFTPLKKISLNKTLIYIYIFITRSRVFIHKFEALFSPHNLLCIKLTFKKLCRVLNSSTWFQNILSHHNFNSFLSSCQFNLQYVQIGGKLFITSSKCLSQFYLIFSSF